MIQVSNALMEYLSGEARTFTAEIYCKNTLITEGIQSIKHTSFSTSEDTLTLGCVAASYVEITMDKPGVTLENQEIFIQFGAKLSTGMEYIPLGFFAVNKLENNGETISFTAYDRMLKFDKGYFSNLSYPNKLKTVLNEICVFCDVQLAEQGIPDIAIASKIEGYTCREALQILTQLAGGNAYVNRSGKLSIGWYAITDYSADNSRYKAFTRNEFDYVIERIKCAISNDESLVSGSGNKGIDISNPYMSQSILNNVYSKVSGFTYRPGEVKIALGDFRLEQCDIIKVYDKDGNVYLVPCLELVHEWDGGCWTTVKAVGKTDAETEVNFKGPTATKIDRVYTKLALVEHAIVNKLDVEVANITYATISNLTATNAKIQDLQVNKLGVDEAAIKYANIEDLVAASAKIAILETVTGDITHLVNGNLTSGNILNLNLTSKNTTIENALIKNAVMQSVSVADLLAGTISTNKFKIMSDDGGIEIAGATQQWKDSDGIIRMQAGQDKTGNFTFSIFNKAGTGVLIDADGIKAGAVPAGLIVDNMVADNANIQGSKVDIKSLVTEINAGDTKVLGSTVQLDASGQTLDVAFSQVHEEINAIASEDGTYLLQVYTEGSHVGDEETATLYARVYEKNVEITSTISADRFLWKRTSESAEEDIKWNSKQLTGYSITLKGDDVYMLATFSCTVTIPDVYVISDVSSNPITDINGNEILGLYV